MKNTRKNNLRSKSTFPKKSFNKTFTKKIAAKINKQPLGQKPIDKPKIHTAKSLDDLKEQLLAWAKNEKLPGKIQAWFTKETAPQDMDWHIVKVTKGNLEFLKIDSPTAIEIPNVVTNVFEQLKKEHLRIFSKALKQIWFRATGEGHFAMLVQVNLRGKFSVHGYKTFIDFLQRNCPEIISCHSVQCTPDRLFDPSTQVNAKIEAKAAFGSDYMPIANTGLNMHVLDWAPKARTPWINLPKRIENAIHPTPMDSLLEFYSGCSYVGATLSNLFKRVVCMDCRENAMLSSHMNAQNLPKANMQFIRSHIEQEFFSKFFGKSDNDGRWTFYFNLPQGESLPQGVVQMSARSRPERILLQTASLDIASKTIKRFRDEGYMLRKSIPLYLEPGSGKFEVMFLLVPDRAHVLGCIQNRKSFNVQKPKETLNKGLNTKKSRISEHFNTKAPTFKQIKD